MTTNSTSLPPNNARPMIEIPQGLPKVEFSENSYQVLQKGTSEKGKMVN